MHGIKNERETRKGVDLMKKIYRFVLKYRFIIPGVLLLLLTAGILSVPERTLAGFNDAAEIRESARTASWNAAMSPAAPDSTELLADGTSVSPEIVFTVASSAETACMYTIRFTGVPEGVGVSLDGSAYSAGSGGVVSFENASWQFAAGETVPQEHRIRFKCLAPMDAGTDEIIAEALFTQID